ncbi:AI-2E family transporter, partial [Nonomuraea sp. NPDC049784]
MPATLARVAAWCACLIVIGIVANYVFGFVATMRIVALPVAVAQLLTALLFPLTRHQRSVERRVGEEC